METHDCSICHDLINIDALKLDCGHEFHETCFLTWYEIKNSCPLCREAVGNHTVRDIQEEIKKREKRAHRRERLRKMRIRKEEERKEEEKKRRNESEKAALKASLPFIPAIDFSPILKARKRKEREMWEMINDMRDNHSRYLDETLDHL